MSDILNRAEELAERYNSSGFIHKEATLLLPELIAEIKQQAAYVARLETAFTRLYVNELVGCNMQRDIAEKHAREALEKIRGEKE